MLGAGADFGHTAQMLAEPVRICHITKTRLPKPFLQGFGLVAHPETGASWWLPAAFARQPKDRADESSTKNKAPSSTPKERGDESSTEDEAPSSTLKEQADESSTEDEAHSSTPEERADVSATKDEATSNTAPTQTHGFLDTIITLFTRKDDAIPSPKDDPTPSTAAPEPLPTEPTQTEEQPTPPKEQDPFLDEEDEEDNQDDETPQPGRFFAPARALSRHDLLREFTIPHRRYTVGNHRFAALNAIGSKAERAVWRKDMHDVLREHLRAGIVDDLAAAAQQQQDEEGETDMRSLVAVGGPEDAAKLQNKACFLRTGDEDGARAPFEYLEVPGVPGTARPVYCLPWLLGEEQLARLCAAAPQFGEVGGVVGFEGEEAF